MKRLVFLFVIVIILGISVITIANISGKKEDKSIMEYDKERSSHGEFSITDGYVIVKDNIYVVNKSNKDVYFYMNADMTKDYGLVLDNKVPSYEKNSFKRKKYFIKAKSEGVYTASFKSKHGGKKTKVDRLPPDSIAFEIIQ